MTITSITTVLLIWLVVATVTGVSAQPTDGPTTTRVAIPDTEIHQLAAKNIGDTFELWVAQPQAGFVPIRKESIQVLYVLDANLFFGTAVEMTRLMHKLYGELPPILVVGIAYPTDNGFLQGALRARDFTPSVHEEMAALSKSFPQAAEMPKVEPAMGGADAFLQFFQQEIKPFIEETYGVQDAGDTIFGSSLGGLFVAHTLVKAPDLFDNYVAVSPALWWNKDEIFQHLPELTALGEAGQVNVFFSAGSLEENVNIPGINDFKMVSNARRMIELLDARDDKNLSVAFVEIEGETHTSVVPAGLTRGLRHVLGRANQPN